MSGYCPYLHKDKIERITCEGGTTKFPDPDARSSFVYTYCASKSGWKNCPTARMLNEYYDRKSKGE